MAFFRKRHQQPKTVFARAWFVRAARLDDDIYPDIERTVSSVAGMNNASNVMPFPRKPCSAGY